MHIHMFMAHYSILHDRLFVKLNVVKSAHYVQCIYLFIYTYYIFGLFDN